MSAAEPVRVILSGCNGHMGRTVTGIISKTEDITITAGIDPFQGIENDYPVYETPEKCAEAGVESDVVIDFSSPAVLNSLLEYGKAKKLPMVLCTTGYTEEQKAQIEAASKEIAILKSANMSLGINVLAKLIREAAAQLTEAGCDVEIVEKHHNLKKDAPSGTAILLADAVNGGLAEKYDYVYDRSGRNEKRPVKEIGISAVRAGTIPGDHDVIFGGEDEVITFSHRAYSKAVFGKGAVQAAKFLKGREPGFYTMADVIG